jgi:hypothetical protein
MVPEVGDRQQQPHGEQHSDDQPTRRPHYFFPVVLGVASALATIRRDRRAVKIALIGNSVRKKNTVTVPSTSGKWLMAFPLSLLHWHLLYQVQYL